jgi:hypothetical protein
MLKLNTVQQNTGVSTNNFLGYQSFQIAWHTTIGLCDVGGFEILPPGTAAQLKY